MMVVVRAGWLEQLATGELLNETFSLDFEVGSEGGCYYDRLAKQQQRLCKTQIGLIVI